MNKWIKRFIVLLSLMLLLSTCCINVYANDSTGSNETYSFGINAINTSVKEGQSMLLTPAYGETVVSNNNNEENEISEADIKIAEGKNWKF